jgi:hypothetical protein
MTPLRRGLQHYRSTVHAFCAALLADMTGDEAFPLMYEV